MIVLIVEVLLIEMVTEKMDFKDIFVEIAKENQRKNKKNTW